MSGNLLLLVVFCFLLRALTGSWGWFRFVVVFVAICGAAILFGFNDRAFDGFSFFAILIGGSIAILRALFKLMMRTAEKVGERMP